MRMIFGLVLIVGLALAGFAVYMAQGFISQTQAELQKERATLAKLGPLADVYIVTKPFAYGDVLTAEDVRVIPWPKSAMPEGAFTDKAALFPEGAKPRLVVRQMETFEPVLASKVTEPGEDAGITTRLAKGMRAFAISVDVSSGVSGFLRPDDKIDVYWTGSVGGNRWRTHPSDRNRRPACRGRPAGRTMTARRPPSSRAPSPSPSRRSRLRAWHRPRPQAACPCLSSAPVTICAAEAIDVDSKELLGIQPDATPEALPEERVCSVKTRKGADVIEMPIPCTN